MTFGWYIMCKWSVFYLGFSSILYRRGGRTCHISAWWDIARTHEMSSVDTTVILHKATLTLLQWLYACIYIAVACKYTCIHKTYNKHWGFALQYFSFISVGVEWSSRRTVLVGWWVWTQDYGGGFWYYHWWQWSLSTLDDRQLYGCIRIEVAITDAFILCEYFCLHW